MLHQQLEQTIAKLTTRAKGILAADESNATISKRFAACNIPSTAELRRDYRELLFSTPNLSDHIAGVILHEETLNQNNSAGIPLVSILQTNNMLAGIKVDQGLIPLRNLANFSTPQESMTQGIDNLATRLGTYSAKGASFTKWRCVYHITPETPSMAAIRANADSLALYAAIAQSQGLVPIVEPEVLLDGEHNIVQCATVTEQVLCELFAALRAYNVVLELIILKPSMVLPGNKCTLPASVEQVAQQTVAVLKRSVPAAVPTINFLSGGQTSTNATAHLNAMNQHPKLPWILSYSYARALQEEAMAIWHGNPSNITKAQQSLLQRAKLNSLATVGLYQESMGS